MGSPPRRANGSILELIRNPRTDEYEDMAPLRDLRLMADEDLMVLVGRRDADAFEVVYDRHADRAFSLAYRMLGVRAAAEEVVQDAFLALWRSGEKYRPDRASVRTWLLGIVHHRAVDALRRTTIRRPAAPAGEALAELQAAEELTDVEAARREEARMLRQALTALPPDQCRVIEMAYYGGFTHTEIADMLGIPLGTVKGRMRLALEKMHTRLGELAS